MQYKSTMLKLVYRLYVGCYTLVSCAGVLSSHVQVADSFKHRQLTDAQVSLFTSKQKKNPSIGELVVCRQKDGLWKFGIISTRWPDEYYDIQDLEGQVCSKHVAFSFIKTLTPMWQQLFQPEVSLEAMRILLDKQIDYYKKHGAPDGHGMILPARSKIIVLGDLHGHFLSLQSHLARMYKEGLLDDQLHLKADCYLVGLGDYTGDGEQGIPVLYTLLKIQENNPGKVFLLRGDHEDASQAQINGFQKEWYGTFGGTRKDFCLSELVWLKMLMVWKSLPKMLLMGLAMPSTQSYEFLMFCHGGFDFAWRPNSFMSEIVEKHINQCYKSPCQVSYRDKQCSDRAFSTGTFADEADIAKMRVKNQAGKGALWSKSAFAQFIDSYASRIDKKHMYQYCLCAIVRGHEHIPGGIVAFRPKGLKTWKPLKDGKSYEVNPCSIYTCTAASECMSPSGCFDGALGVIEAACNGHWYITSYLEQ